MLQAHTFLRLLLFCRFHLVATFAYGKRLPPLNTLYTRVISLLCFAWHLDFMLPHASAAAFSLILAFYSLYQFILSTFDFPLVSVDV